VKKLLFILLFFIAFAAKSFGQEVIMAKEAYKHVGQMITVKDSVYFGQVYNDSTATVELGNRRLISPLTVVFSAGKNPKLADPNFIADIQRTRISVSGLIMLIKGHPTLIVLKWNDFKMDPKNAMASTSQ
jgi:hypothetical protein